MQLCPDMPAPAVKFKRGRRVGRREAPGYSAPFPNDVAEHRMPSTTRALRAMLLLFPLLLLLLVPALPAWAQSAAPAPAATAAEPSAAELEELIATIEDEGRRKVLLGQLRTLLAAQAEGQAEEEETLGTRLLSELSDRKSVV